MNSSELMPLPQRTGTIISPLRPESDSDFIRYRPSSRVSDLRKKFEQPSNGVRSPITQRNPPSPASSLVDTDKQHPHQVLIIDTKPSTPLGLREHTIPSPRAM
ncbi:hypothetical protein Ciccas_007514 [Cichlidogyrus casuarinus]|uniref:Uncharacterized protein n=1 Tax=Cichlidogyrus casuarinus TaxID=1844966 RepID=A0ABD2Q2N7_9PLAT